ncbi:MAG: tetratricopeptide repeat protein [Anaerolineales bacterium]|nr:tetratricopeptide repeat protein [Anaerolineales bacterium]
MPISREISEALDRLSNGNPQPNDLEIVRAAITAGDISIGRDMNQSILVRGDNNQVSLNFDLSPEILQNLLQKPVIDTKPGDLPPGSYLPFPRNRLFTGRVADIEKLSQALLNGEQAGAVINQTITGMGGLGKTQLAVEFAYRFGYQFKGVHWLDMREVQTLESQIALCGMKMTLPNFPPTQPEQVEATKYEWVTNGPRLLILDNFEDYDAANVVLGALQHSNLKLLITSRHTNWATGLGLNHLPLDEFSPQESVEFLRKYIPPEREDESDPERLAEHLGHLPLALELAGRYLEKQPRLKIDAYLAQTQKALEHRSMQNWKVEQKSLTGHDLSLAQTFAQSWELVKGETAQRLFITLGYCAPNTPIPQEILDAALGENADACDDCLSELSGLGLLKEGISIHPLLAEYARGFDEEFKNLTSFSENLAILASQTNRDADQKGNYSLFTPILFHVRSAAEYAETAELEPAGTLWNEIGYHVKYLADYIGAKAAYERALKIDEAAFGPDHPKVAIRVNNLGSVLQALGDHAGAKAAFERALKIDEAVFGPDHPNVAIRVWWLGVMARDEGETIKAKEYLERALRIFQKSLPPEHPNIKNVQSYLESL